MIHPPRLIQLLSYVVLLVPLTVFSEPLPDQELDEARTMVREFGQQLKGRLVQAMSDGGAVAAINECKIAAPAIADKLSRDSQWSLGRRSLKLRNPANQPDAWELKVLQEFELRKSRGEDVSQLEHHATLLEQGKLVFRYMKAIPTAELCLSCHGTTLEPAVRSALRQHYPDDQARGFQTGDIRGAFSLRREE